MDDGRLLDDRRKRKRKVKKGNDLKEAFPRDITIIRQSFPFDFKRES